MADYPAEIVDPALLVQEQTAEAFEVDPVSWLGLFGSPSTELVIEGQSPAEGATIGPLEILSFDVLTTRAASEVLLTLRFGDATGTEETPFRAGAFRGYYSNPRSSVTASSGRLAFKVYRAGGWVSSPEISAHAVLSTVT